MLTSSGDPASRDRSAADRRDLLASPWSAFVWWGLPFLVGASTNFLPIAETAKTLLWAAALAWMGVGCALNALRCDRLHCYIAAPVFFIGAAGAVAASFGLVPLGLSTASWVINLTLLLAVASFLVEPVWGKYRSPA